MKTEYMLWEILRDLYRLPLNTKFISTFKGWEGHAIKITPTGGNSRVIKWVSSPYGANESRSDPLKLYTAATDYPWTLVRSGVTAHLFKEEQSIMDNSKNAAEANSEGLMTTLVMMGKIKTNDIYESDDGFKHVSINAAGDIVHYGGLHNGYPVKMTGSFMNQTWKRQEKQVDFWEAFVAYRGYNGKTRTKIKSVRSGIIYVPASQAKYQFQEDDIAGQWVILDD